MNNFDRREITKPNIKVYYSFDKLQLAKFSDLFLGMEEEGIPYELVEKSVGSAVEIAFEASSASTLGVGIGLSSNDVAVHFDKLEESKPLFKISSDSKASQIRLMGTNAARLVKKMPFKSEND